MAANPIARFTASPLLGAVSISIAETSLTAPTNYGVLVDATTASNAIGDKRDGVRIDYVFAKAVGATTAGMVRMFLYRSATFHLLGEISVTAVAAPSSTVQTWEGSWLTLPNTCATSESNGRVLILEVGDQLRVTTAIGETFRVFAYGGWF
jgi:hypothetical protein